MQHTPLMRREMIFPFQAYTGKRGRKTRKNIAKREVYGNWPWKRCSSSVHNPVFTRLVAFFSVTQKRKVIVAPRERRNEDLSKVGRKKETKGFHRESWKWPYARKIRRKSTQGREDTTWENNTYNIEKESRQDCTRQSKLFSKCSKPQFLKKKLSYLSRDFFKLP